MQQSDLGVSSEGSLVSENLSDQGWNKSEHTRGQPCSTESVPESLQVSLQLSPGHGRCLTVEPPLLGSVISRLFPPRVPGTLRDVETALFSNITLFTVAVPQCPLPCRPWNHLGAFKLPVTSPRPGTDKSENHGPI